MKAPKVLAALSTCVALFIFAGCSDVKNRSKEEHNDKKAAIGVTIESSTTTDGTTTENTIDNDLKKQITSTLSRALIAGVTDKDLFTEGVLEQAAVDFPDNTKAMDNEVTASFHVMKKADGNKDLVVASIKHTYSTTSGKVSQSGQIYFNDDAKIIGFSFPDTEPTPTSQGTTA